MTHVISSHHHFDHSAGLREFVAAGVQVVMHEEARAFFEGIFRAASTIVPDTLAATPGAQPSIISVPAVAGVDLDDADAPVRVLPLISSHAKDMVMVYVDIAGSETVFVSDIFSPGFPAAGPGPAEVLAGIEEFELEVAHIAGGHGVGTATLAELQAIVNPTR